MCYSVHNNFDNDRSISCIATSDLVPYSMIASCVKPPQLAGSSLLVSITTLKLDRDPLFSLNLSLIKSGLGNLLRPLTFFLKINLTSQPFLWYNSIIEKRGNNDVQHTSSNHQYFHTLTQCTIARTNNAVKSKEYTQTHRY